MMMNEPQSTEEAEFQNASAGNGSVAHQIIGQFLDALRKEEGYENIAARLQTTIFGGKPTEAALRAALFGDDPL